MNTQRASHFLVVLLLILSLKMFSQQQIPRIEQKNPHRIEISSYYPSWTRSLFDTSKWYPGDLAAQFKGIGDRDWLNGYGRVLHLWDNPASPLPFFCRKEYQFEKTTSIPLRFRLGSLEYVNRMEGKINAWQVF